MAGTTTQPTPPAQTPPANGSVPPWLQAILAAAGATAGNLYGRSQANSNVPPELTQLLQLGVQRAQSETPLHNAAQSGLLQMLPNFAQQGGAAMSAAQPAAQSGGGGMNPLLAGLLGAAGGSALGGLSNGGSAIPFKDIIEGLKRLFAKGGTVQGDKPYPGGATMNPTQQFDPHQFMGWDTSVSDPSGNPYLPSDPGVYYGDSGSGAMPTDPSGGTGVGPGMQQFYSGGFWGAGNPNEE